ncbi:MAG TPA: hypothetical protein VE440_04920 [Gaiellaceae bacterium]|jgi:hypothetical protein|nr:hypothetical protein [Gaiellaceae bacterium]
MSERESSEIEFDFFEEPATTEAARPERRPRRPRRGRRPPGPPSGLTPLVRLIGLISLAILVVVLLVFWISSCRGEAKKDTYRSYMQDVDRIANESEKIGARLNTALTRADIRQAELTRTLDGLAQQQVQLVDSAETLDEPGPLRDEHRHMVEALQFRVSGLRGIGDAFSARTRNATQAADGLAAQARRLIASDVVWDDQFEDPAKAELRRQDIQGVNVPDSNFFQNPGLATTTAMTAIWQRVRGAATGGPTSPGSHGHNLVSVKVLGGATLSPDDLNEIVATTDLSFQVVFENSGDSTETGVQVTLTIQKSPEPIVRRQTVDVTEEGQQKTVVFRNISNVPFVRRTTLQVEVNEVPGEQNLANNTAEYPVIFSYPGG